MSAIKAALHQPAIVQIRQSLHIFDCLLHPEKLQWLPATFSIYKPCRDLCGTPSMMSVLSQCLQSIGRASYAVSMQHPEDWELINYLVSAFSDASANRLNVHASSAHGSLAHLRSSSNNVARRRHAAMRQCIALACMQNMHVP